MRAPDTDISTANQHVAPGRRQWNADGAEKPDAGQAVGAIRPQPGDPTDPAAADARAAGRDAAQKNARAGRRRPKFDGWDVKRPLTKADRSARVADIHLRLLAEAATAALDRQAASATAHHQDG